MNAKRKFNLFEIVRGYIHRINHHDSSTAHDDSRFGRWLKRGIVFIILAHILGILINYLLFRYEFRDDNEYRGAAAVSHALFEENHNIPSYLDQGWEKEDSLWFYKTTQGSNLLPYDFYMSLEQAGNNKPFNSNDNLRKYQYLIQNKTPSNPDGLPVGFTKDTFKDKEYIGFTCAACHTSQINYTDISGTKEAIRIDGGPGQSNLEQFMYDLSDALNETLCIDVKSGCDSEKLKRFTNKVLSRNDLKQALLSERNYNDEKQIKRDLEAVSLSIKYYNVVNNPNRESLPGNTLTKNVTTPPDKSYGFSRLDAFGRIYNRVAQHVINEDTLEKIFFELVSEGVMTEEEKNESFNKVITTGKKNIHLVDKTLSLDSLNDFQKEKFIDLVFTKADAPVSYPYLWDIPYQDFVQWNGMAKNAGGGALGRNIGQLIGVFGTLDWKTSDGLFSPSDILIEKKSVLNNIDFHSSVNSRNLFRIEGQLKKLKSPVWPEDKLGEIDKDKSKAGKKIFKHYCIDCHNNIDRENSQRRIITHLSSIKNVGTDPKMAENSVLKSGYTGILQGSYVGVSVGDIMLQEKAAVSLMVTAATENSLKTADIDTNILARWSDWIYDTFLAIIENPVKETIKQGNYDSDTSTKPFNSLLSYKARPLNGIWATAPYLHNGSVPTLYDLLLPAEERPSQFMVGSRVFDSDKVGFKSVGYKGFNFNTQTEGNSNKGHEYAAGRTALANGQTLDPLTEVQRLELLEYLKSL